MVKKIINSKHVKMATTKMRSHPVVLNCSFYYQNDKAFWIKLSK